MSTELRFGLWALLLIVPSAYAQSTTPPTADVGVETHVLVYRTSADLSQSWLRPGEELTPESFHRLVDVARIDENTSQALDGMLTRLGFASADELLPYFRIVEALGDHTHAGTSTQTGEFDSARSTEYFQALSPETPAEPQGLVWPSEIQAHIARSWRSSESRTNTLGIVRVSESPLFCIVRDRPLLDSFVTFMHELTHFSAMADLTRQDTINYESLEHFITSRLTAPGGELDAFISEGAAAVRLARFASGRLANASGLTRYFDDEGQLTDRDGLLRFIRQDLGYDAHLRDEFIRLVHSDHNSDLRHEAFLRDQVLPFSERQITSYGVAADAYENYATALENWSVSSTEERQRARSLATKYRSNQTFYQNYSSNALAEVAEYNRVRCLRLARFSTLFEVNELQEALLTCTTDLP